MAVQDPVIVVPGITAIDLVDDYPPKADEMSTMVFNKEYDRIMICKAYCRVSNWSGVS